MNDDSSKEFDRITDLGKARSNEYTEKLLAFVQDMESSSPEPFIPLLADIALGSGMVLAEPALAGGAVYVSTTGGQVIKLKP